MPWKMPTWKGVIGLLALASSIITALTVNSSTLPHSFEATLFTIGGVLLAVERVADAVDNATAVSKVAVTAPPAQPVQTEAVPVVSNVN